MDNKRIYSALGLVLSSLYMLYLGLLHHGALSSQMAFINSKKLQINAQRVMPVIFSPGDWRGIARDNNDIYLTHIHTDWLGHTTIMPLGSIPLFTKKQLPEWVVDSKSLIKDYNIFSWFSDQYLTPTNLKPLTLADARYIFYDKKYVALWGISFKTDTQHITRERLIPIKSE